MARAAAAPGVRSDSLWRCHPPGRHRPPFGHDRSEDLRPVPRTHQPLGRGWSLRRADPRRRLRGPRLRDVLDTVWTAGRGAHRRGSVRAWDEERADHRRPPAVGNQASARVPGVRPELCRVGLDQDRVGRATPVTARAGGGWPRAGGSSAPGARVGVAGSALLVRERAERSRRGGRDRRRRTRRRCSSTSFR